MPHVIACGLAALLSCSVTPAAATLGEQHASMAGAVAPGKAMAPVAPSEANRSSPDFYAHPHLLPSGTRVVEYVDTRGTVFAVTWSGPYLPDLRALLGRHFEAFALQQQQQAGLHAPVVVRSADVVIHAGGRMGAFDGRAWLPGRLPARFDLGAL